MDFIKAIQGIKLPEISQEDMMKVLDTCYQQAINGIPGSKTCEQLAEEYTNRYDSLENAARQFISWQVAKMWYFWIFNWIRWINYTSSCNSC